MSTIFQNAESPHLGLNIHESGRVGPLITNEAVRRAESRCVRNACNGRKKYWRAISCRRLQQIETTNDRKKSWMRKGKPRRATRAYVFVFMKICYHIASCITTPEYTIDVRSLANFNCKRLYIVHCIRDGKINRVL